MCQFGDVGNLEITVLSWQSAENEESIGNGDECLSVESLESEDVDDRLSKSMRLSIESVFKCSTVDLKFDELGNGVLDKVGNGVLSRVSNGVLEVASDRTQEGVSGDVTGKEDNALGEVLVDSSSEVDDVHDKEPEDTTDEEDDVHDKVLDNTTDEEDDVHDEVLDNTTDGQDDVHDVVTDDATGEGGDVFDVVLGILTPLE